MPFMPFRRLTGQGRGNQSAMNPPRPKMANPKAGMFPQPENYRKRTPMPVDRNPAINDQGQYV